MKLFTKKEDQFESIKVAFSVTKKEHEDILKFLENQKLSLSDFMADSVRFSLIYLRKNKETKEIFKSHSKSPSKQEKDV